VGGQTSVTGSLNVCLAHLQLSHESLEVVGARPRGSVAGEVARVSSSCLSQLADQGAKY